MRDLGITLSLLDALMGLYVAGYLIKMLWLQVIYIANAIIYKFERQVLFAKFGCLDHKLLLLIFS